MAELIADVLDIANSERYYTRQVGETVLFDALTHIAAEMNVDAMEALSLLVGLYTDKFQVNFTPSAGGYLQRTTKKTQADNIQPKPKWTVGCTIESWGDAIASDWVTAAYLTINDLQRAIDTVEQRNINTMRREILRRILRNTAQTFDDDVNNSSTMQPLANGDTVKYPPKSGSTDFATRNHYVVAGYLANAISNTNNPAKTAGRALEDMFGGGRNGLNVLHFGGATWADKMAELTGFVASDDLWITAGDGTARIPNLPDNVPGNVIGRVPRWGWIVQWDFIPDNYSFSMHADADAPMMMRQDLVEVGIPQGLFLKSESDKHPFSKSEWVHRFGVSVWNRLNGYVMQYKASGNYDIPTVA